MSSIVLRKLATPYQLSRSDIYDISNPLNFQDWKLNHISVVPNDAQKQYETYLSTFYSKKETKKDTTSTNIKADYVALVKSLSTIFKDDTSFDRFSKIDFSSTTDLKIAIPFFAKKLKEIAIYYAQSRAKIKTTKEHYSTIGSELGIERHLYSNLLSKFINQPNGIVGLYGTNSTDLSAISNTFSIDIEELYDTTNYFDRGKLDINPLFCVLNDYVGNICNRLDTILLSNITNPLESTYLCETDTLDMNSLLSNGWEKYLGDNLYYLSGGGMSLNNSIDISVDIGRGNNFFYWFSGQTANDIPEGRYMDLPLSSIDWHGATGSSFFTGADIIFISYGNLKTEGAWLMSANHITAQHDMTANISSDREFIFPYPGIGLSAESGKWTGRLITDAYQEDRRFFPSEVNYQDTQKEITKLYWSDSVSISSVIPISIQNTSLYKDGGYASNKFSNADRISVRYKDDTKVHDPLYHQKTTAWLYRFNQTQLPITQGTNNIYYPLTSYQNVSDLYFDYDSDEQVALSAIPVNESFVGAVAGEAMDSADFLIKLKTPCGPEIEGAWLKGYSNSYLQGIRTLDDRCSSGEDRELYTGWQYTAGNTQPGISFKVDAGSTHRFVWHGPDTDINDIKGFTGFVHDTSCEYYNSISDISIFDIDFLNVDRVDVFERWRQCSCKTVNYSPIGHMGNTLKHKATIPDFIAVDTQQGLDFSIFDWKGSDNKKIETSTDVIWFNPDQLREKDIGWSKGRWRNINNTSLILKKGQSYIMYRSNLDACNYTMPYFVINHGYNNTTISSNTCEKLSNIPIWQKAIRDHNGVWIDTGEISDMSLGIGDFFKYIHQSEHKVSRRKLLYNGTEIDSVSGDYITLYYSNTAISYSDYTFTIPSINFLVKIPLLSAMPYWGKAFEDDSRETRNKLINIGTTDNRILYDYLQITQPIPSDIVLSDNTIIKYDLSNLNNCFVWKQPLTFSTNQPVLRWNKIETDACTQSDILNYLHERGNTKCDSYVPACYSECQITSICGSTDICEPAKIGVTATNIPSDIVLNTELSGIPLFVNYYGRNDFTFRCAVTDAASLETYTPPVTGLLVAALAPWRNLINDSSASIAYEQITDNLYNKHQLGLFIPNRVGTGKYELHESNYIVSPSSEITTFNENRYNDNITPIHIKSKWLKDSNGYPIKDIHQTYYPYIETTKTIPISGDLISYQNDIYGNRYYLTNNNSIYVESVDGMISSGLDFLAPILDRYRNILFNDDSDYEGTAITTEDGSIILTEDGSIIVIG